MQKDYLERVYAGFLGMNIGIRLGAPVEPTIWTYERIRDTYGDITDYVKEYKNFAADDDVNGPVYFFRALRDDAEDRELKPQDVANAWLNYAREGVGMFWWGGYSKLAAGFLSKSRNISGGRADDRGRLQRQASLL